MVNVKHLTLLIFQRWEPSSNYTKDDSHLCHIETEFLLWFFLIWNFLEPEIDEEESADENNIPTNGVDDGFYNNETKPTSPEDDHLEPKFPMFPATYPAVYGTGVILNGATPRIVPDVNVYQNKKTLAQGFMDLALLSANANQLRYVLETHGRHPYYYFSLSFIIISLSIQVVVGIGLLLNSRYNVKDEEDICKADRINNYITVGILLITITNVFISAFGVAKAEDFWFCYRVANELFEKIELDDYCISE